jgi:hypothetical protein
MFGNKRADHLCGYLIIPLVTFIRKLSYWLEQSVPMSDEEKRYLQKSIGGVAPFTAPLKPTKVKASPEGDSMEVSSAGHDPREGDIAQDYEQSRRVQIARMQEHEMLKSLLVKARMGNAKSSPAYHDGSERHYQTPQRPTVGVQASR